MPINNLGGLNQPVNLKKESQAVPKKETPDDIKKQIQALQNELKKFSPDDDPKRYESIENGINTLINKLKSMTYESDELSNALRGKTK